MVFLLGTLYAPCDLTLAYLLPSTPFSANREFPGVNDDGCIAGRIGSVKLVRTTGLYPVVDSAAACTGRRNWASCMAGRLCEGRIASSPSAVGVKLGAFN